jgi:enoyl-CoA hydratase
VGADGVPAQRPEQPLGGALRPGVDDDVAEQVGVDPVAGGERDVEDVLGDAAGRHAPDPMPGADLYGPAMPDEPVLTERRDGVLLITLNRPDARNAVNGDVANGMAEALDHLDSEDDLRVGIVTGAGGYFSAGMDLKAFVQGQSPYAGDRGFAGIAQRSSRKPLIAAVEGFALAGGFEIALSCDLIVASREARFGIPEVKRSLVAAAGALLRLPKRIPYHLAMELALTGDPIDAERAREIGIVNRLAEPGTALDTAIELAQQVVKNAPLALIASKEIVQNAVDWSEEEGWAKQGEISGPVFTSEDAREGATAFAEKREPVWQGR